MTERQPLFATADPDTGRPALLLLHGMLTSSLHWQPNAALSDHFRLIHVDLPGHGASPPPMTPEEAHPAAIIAAIETIRQRLGITAWHLCGASFGAGIALHYALDHPYTCLSVSFTNSNSALRPAWTVSDLQAQAGLAARIRAGRRDAVRALPYHPAHARRFPSDLRATLTDVAERILPETVALLQQEAIPRLTVRHHLGGLQRRCQLLNGKFERRFQAVRDWLAKAHPRIVIVDLPGGHSVNIENPKDFDAAMIAFLNNSGP
ncbi:alpha/beta fold hydrolase [Szabonella alba]|uniref:Alpha/beta fold hydrolase n=1 Tax=Szabonella alba TaxID=2804194 RepID=A0A8K0VC74_9RHOB|nr:alpha/beta fold hydrolase [Szabonella alba]MBL4919223.1 alpha/beta fold hydrolase [Szabonella alba]